jgi:hypothetical protein
MRRPYSYAVKQEEMPPPTMPWVVPVGILGTAAETLARVSTDASTPGRSDPGPGVGVAFVDLHRVLLAAAVRFCCGSNRAYVLADAAASLLAVRLVECGQLEDSSGEDPCRLVRRWADGRTLTEVARKLAVVASVERWRRLAETLGRDGLDAWLRSEVASGVAVSGAALARLDFARWATVGGDLP